jgi:two-component system chemotaxis sensor kinase CheA
MSLDPMEQAKNTFFAECRDLMQIYEDTLVALSPEDIDPAMVNDLFRAMHTIKGSAGLFAFDEVVGFTHVVESLLDRLRRQEVQWSRELVDLLLQCEDHTSDLVDHVEEAAVPIGEPLRRRDQALRERLAEVMGIESSLALAPKLFEREVVIFDEEGGLGPEVGECWGLSARFGEGILQHGFDPIQILRYLGSLGTLVHVELSLQDLPPLSDLDPLACHLGFDVALRTDADKTTVEGAFEFIRDDCKLRIVPPRSKHTYFLQAIQQISDGGQRLGEILVQVGAITRNELYQALVQQHKDLLADEATPLPIGQLLVNQGVVPPEIVKAAAEKQGRERKTQDMRFIKVAAEKLDHLINLVGELVIAGAGANLQAAALRQTEMLESTALIQRLVEEIRGSALSLRMVQIGETFNRFNRVVRDLSQELGKDIRLEITGAETELDKTVVERISDPLMHLVRNALDHGIESPTERVECGKSAQALLRLSAHHDSGSIIIEVSDDGRGIDPERVRRKAVERGMLTADDSPTRAELFALLFEPGFSTAEKVSNISGRGVGMDVVRQNVLALRGTIDVDSELTRGTAVRVRLPLTLAIIDGFLVGVGDARFVVPLEAVVECLELDSQLVSLDRDYLNLRGEVLPFVRLRRRFGLAGAQRQGRESVVVVRQGNTRAGIVVDTLMGELQTVIKPLAKLFGRIPGLAGSSILGSGEVALILDVPAMLATATRRKGERTESDDVSSAAVV